MAEVEKAHSGAKEFRNLILIVLGISVLVLLVQGLVAWSGTPCGWAARFKGSGCVKIVERKVSPLGAANIYFSHDDSRIFFLDRSVIRIEPAYTSSLLDSGKSVPIFSSRFANKGQKLPFNIERFALSPDGKLAVLCADYWVEGYDFEEKLLLKEIDSSVDAQDVFPDVPCFWRELDFISSSVVSLNLYEEADGRRSVLFLDVLENTQRSLPGQRLTGYSENSNVLPIQVTEKTLALYSFPALEKLNEFVVPAKLRAAMIPSEGSYVFASAYQASIYMIDRLSGELVYTFSDQAYAISRVFTVSRRGDLVAAAFSNVGPDASSTLYIWNSSDKHIVKKLLLDDLDLEPQSLDFSADGKLLAIGTWKYVIILDLTK